MPRVNVISYSAGWNLNRKLGVVRFRASDGTWSPVYTIIDPSEFAAVVDLLRNEKQIYYYPETAVLSTSEEPIGEGE